MNNLAQNIRAVLTELTAGYEAAVWTTLIQLYLDNAPQLILQLQQANAQQNLQQILITAHSLKSSSATLGICNMSEFCKTIEQLSPNLAKINQHIQTINVEYDKTVVVLKTFLDH